MCHQDRQDSRRPLVFNFSRLEEERRGSTVIRAEVIFGEEQINRYVKMIWGKKVTCQNMNVILKF